VKYAPSKIVSGQNVSCVFSKFIVIGFVKIEVRQDDSFGASSEYSSEFFSIILLLLFIVISKLFPPSSNSSP